MALATTRKPWLCTKCGAKNEWRGSSRKCGSCLSPSGRRKKRVPKHAEVLRDTSYATAATLSVTIHGGEPEACGCCGRPKGERNHDRDHDHRTGQFRGLLCWKCNRELLRGHTTETLRACLAYLERAGAAT